MNKNIKYTKDGKDVKFPISFKIYSFIQKVIHKIFKNHYVMVGIEQYGENNHLKPRYEDSWVYISDCKGFRFDVYESTDFISVSEQNKDEVHIGDTVGLKEVKNNE